MIRTENSSHYESTMENYQLPVCKTNGPSSPNKNDKIGNSIDEQPSSVVGAFQVNREQNIDLEKTSNHKSEFRCKLPFEQNCEECVTLKLIGRTETPTGLNALMQTHAIKLPDDKRDRQNKIFILPYSNYCSSSKFGKSDNMESVTDNMGYANNAVSFPVTEVRGSNQRIMDSRTTDTNPAGTIVNQASRRRRSTPNDEVKKATWLILFAVFICYVPGLIISFLFFVNGTQNVKMSFISQLSVLLNSSLNALILIVCSKNVQRKIKALFTKQ